jgi:hypothetical protein
MAWTSRGQASGLWMTTPCWLCGADVQPCGRSDCIKAWRLKPCPEIVTEASERKRREQAAKKGTEA